MTWFRKMFRPVPLDTELWPESQGAGYSPNESNGVLAGYRPWREGLVEPSAVQWDWPKL